MAGRQGSLEEAEGADWDLLAPTKLERKLRPDSASPIDKALWLQNWFIGKHPAIVDVRRLILRFAASPLPVLVLGEPGTGKELVAWAMHALSGRAVGPFIGVNCSALPESLLESELFGHEKGSFSGADRRRKGRFELAGDGTLFLDEVGDIALGCQAKILRALDPGEITPLGSEAVMSVNVRVVSATNRDLEDLRRRNLFRYDFASRLGGVIIVLPALRDHPEDVASYITSFLYEYSEKGGARRSGFSESALGLLYDHPWPGNVRELKAVVCRACEYAHEDVVTEKDVRQALSMSVSLAIPPAPPDPLPEEARHLRRVLEKHRWNKKAAAKHLGISRTTLYAKLAKYRLM